MQMTHTPFAVAPTGQVLELWGVRAMSRSGGRRAGGAAAGWSHTPIIRANTGHSNMLITLIALFQAAQLTSHNCQHRADRQHTPYPDKLLTHFNPGLVYFTKHHLGKHYFTICQLVGHAGRGPVVFVDPR